MGHAAYQGGLAGAGILIAEAHTVGDDHITINWTPDIDAAQTVEPVGNPDRLYGWISVDDRLPNVAGWYIVFYNGSKMQVAFFNGKKFPFDNHYHKVTHWRPLPEPPEGVKWA